MNSIDKRFNINILLKDTILPQIKDLLSTATSDINTKHHQVCSMYGGYSYLSLINKLKLETSPCKNVDDLDLEITRADMTNFNLNCPLEDTLFDLNMIIIKNGEDITEIINICDQLLGQIEKKLKSSTAGITTEIGQEKSKKLFNGITKYIKITKKRRTRAAAAVSTDLESIESTFFIIDIYTENMNIELFKTLTDQDTNGIRTLTKEGFIILSSFVYFESFKRLDINKKRTDDIIMLFTTEEEAFQSIENCLNLFINYSSIYTDKTSFLLKKFLKRFNIEITPTRNLTEDPLYNGFLSLYDKCFTKPADKINFSDFESNFNTFLISTKIFNKKYSLRQIINSFMYEIDKRLRELNLGRFLKTGGEAFRLYSNEQVSNDIDTKIFLKGKVNRKTIAENIICSLFFILDCINKLDNIKIEKTYEFTFAGQLFIYIIKNNERDYLNIKYGDTDLIQLNFNIDDQFKYTKNGETTQFTILGKFFCSPLDIWIYNEVVPEIVDVDLTGASSDISCT